MLYSSLHTITKKECSQYQVFYVPRHNDWALDMGGGGGVSFAPKAWNWSNL
jgi:hypothetical protein